MWRHIKRFSFLNSSRKIAWDGLFAKEQFHRAIEKERYRSDRSDHQYSLLILSLDIARENSESFHRYIQMIRERIRNVDKIGWYDERRLGIILPYTSRKGAEKLAKEICRIVESRLNRRECMECDLFCYAPEDVDLPDGS